MLYLKVSFIKICPCDTLCHELFFVPTVWLFATINQDQVRVEKLSLERIYFNEKKVLNV